MDAAELKPMEVLPDGFQQPTDEPPPYPQYLQQQDFPPQQQQGYLQQQGYSQQSYASQHGNQVIVTQPTAAIHTTVVVRNSSEAADRAVMLSVLNIVCCSSPFGCVALVFAMMAKDHLHSGREEEGMKMVRTAHIINLVGVFVVAIVVFVLIIVAVTA